IAGMFAVGFAGPTLADPPPHAAAKKANKHAGKSAYRGLHMQAYKGGPPPWAPAHGYRRKAGWYDNGYWKDYGLPAPPFDLSAGTCSREGIGQVIGGGLGAAAGSQIGSGSGRLVAVAAGTIVGVLVGGEVGRAMDRTDALCVDQALENAPDGRTIVWNDGRDTYRVTPTETAQTGEGRYCREYRAQSTVDGRESQVYGTACRHA
ncbi:MAG: glycine zipper domain-containing protein, partial [Alphaproteobacteria bacterium]